MNLTTDNNHIDEVEHRIAPPMAQAITVPLVAEMGPRGVDVVIYVGVSAFGSPRNIPASDRELIAVAREIVRRLGAYGASGLSPTPEDDCNQFKEGCD